MPIEADEGVGSNIQFVECRFYLVALAIAGVRKTSLQQILLDIKLTHRRANVAILILLVYQTMQAKYIQRIVFNPAVSRKSPFRRRTL